jgi:hypothetical protein
VVEASEFTLVRKIVIYLMMALIIGRFLCVGLMEVRQNWNSSTYDQRSYLRLGLKIRDRKDLTDGNRHPLYPALISLFAEKEWAYFTKSKLLSLTIGATGLIVVFLLSRRLYSDDVALLATFLLSINQEFIGESSRAICESLFVLLFFTSWYCTVKGFSGRHYWMVAGLCAGLAYLTKGTGQLLLISFVLSAMIIYKTKILKEKRIIVYLLFYLIAASVLLAYNYREYGNPFYNFTITHAMWFDNWEDKYTSGENLPTALTYVNTHTIGDVLARQWDGMKKIGLIFGQPFFQLPTSNPSATLRTGFQLPISLLVGVGMLAALVHFRRNVVSFYRANRERVVFTTVLFVLFYLLFAWFAQVYTAPRFTIPLAPMAYLFIADLIQRLGRAISSRIPPLSFGYALRQAQDTAQDRGSGRAKTIRLATYMAFYACLALWLSLTSAEAARHVLESPFEADRLRNADGENVLSWLERQVGKDERIIWGPSNTLPNWRYAGKLKFEEIPSDITTWEAFGAHLTGKEARYVLLDRETFWRREALLGQYFDRDGGRIAFQSLPPGWALAFAYQGLPCEWCIFELFEPIGYPLEVDLGERVRLLGYELDNRTVKPGDTIRLTLYWRTLEEMDEDYTVFTHLLGKDSLIWGQMDSQPLDGLLPTSNWLAGMIVADGYDIAVAPDTSPGEYQIEVGMYLLETMERLTAVDEAGRHRLRLADDRVLLEPKITVNGGR